MQHLSPHCQRDFFFFNDTATTEIYTLSLHDALPISGLLGSAKVKVIRARVAGRAAVEAHRTLDRHSGMHRREKS